MSLNTNPSDLVATYISSSAFDALPTPVVKEAIRSIVNWAGCAVGGSNHSTVNIAVDTFTAFSGAPTATLLGRAERFDALRAALINGISSHVLDFDDTHPECLIHPGSPVAAAAFALGESLNLSGRDVVNAFVIGVEIECRIADTVAPGHYASGWHATGTAGIFGAAAAASRLLKLDPQRTRCALGIAATQSAGLREMFGSMCKSLNPGKAAENGVTAALLAAKGFTSADKPIEGISGFAAVMSPTRDISKLTRELGSRYFLLGNTYKAFACGIVIHPTIDACIRIRNRVNLPGNTITAVHLKVHPLVLELTGKLTPQTGLEGKFSVYHSAAAAYIDGDCGEAQYSDARVRAAEIIALRQKVRATADPSLRLEEVFAEISYTDGRIETEYVEHCVGSLQNPMSDDQLNSKFLKLCDGVIAKSKAQNALDLLRNLTKLDSVIPALDVLRCP